METNGSSSNSNESQPSGGSNNSSTEKPNEKEIFVNHAEIAWHEKRREWVGDQSQRSRRTPREPIMSWTTTYEDLLLSTEPFQQPIPLAVSFCRSFLFSSLFFLASHLWDNIDMNIII
ncbi:hypothetical protein SO802_030537 [Lithocarpus litseifolius]|uniref:Gag1-like clamp domain-containing protein n=1 Tax=Lithocarpus litseifolius TaxID=425828 RepID=A0AAW2BJY5_9ROSI